MEMVTRSLDNDTRGWILCLVSGFACVAGASIIYADVVVGLIPGKQNFKIQGSNAFLACSLSLSFGVMLYSALCNMLPESKEYFKSDGWSDHTAGLVMMTLFISGFIGIQAVSRVLHQFMPSHVVDCDHSHSDATMHDVHTRANGRGHSQSSHARRRHSRPSSAKMPEIAENGSPMASADTRGPAQRASRIDEATPLLEEGHGPAIRPTRFFAPRGRTMTSDGASDRRPSMAQVQKRVMSFVKDTKPNCDESGPCFGYSDPCGQECFKHLSSRAASHGGQHPTLRTSVSYFHPHSDTVFHGHEPHAHAQQDSCEPQISPRRRASSRDTFDSAPPAGDEDYFAHHATDSEDGGDVEAQHHHHVPTNAFLSIGLQTSIAIALHKFPEGFITFATNHANPDLGFNVFMALFVHNITEGFAMCLPLYMALGSRLRAMAWSALLGGLSQPLGAGVAALWFKLAKRTNMAPGPVAYACLFAMTAGIMVSVALQLFVEGLSLNHNRNLCTFFGFIGMALLGLSNATFAAH